MAQETIDRLLDRLNRERIGAETKMQCKVCWYVYDPKQGCEEFDIAPDTPFYDLPDFFTCPGCGNEKAGFISLNSDEEPAQ